MKKVIAVAVVLGVVAAIVPSAIAGNAHFIKSATSASLDGANLVCTFKEAGLESGSTEMIRCDANALTTYECVNGGEKNPSAANKTTTQSRVGNTGTFSADKNGNVVGSITVTPPSAAALGFSCPPGQTVTFVSVTYSGVTVTDLTSGASSAISGTFTFTNPSAP
ncbi:MAG: hypothetical protein ACJ77Z_18520 [Thermoleophilaceae bacterium]